MEDEKVEETGQEVAQTVQEPAKTPPDINIKGEYERKLEQARKQHEDVVQQNMTLKAEMDAMKEKLESLSVGDLDTKLNEEGINPTAAKLILTEVDRRTKKVEETIRRELKKEHELMVTRTNLLDGNDLYKELPKDHRDEVVKLLDTYPTTSWENPMAIEMAVNKIVVSHLRDKKTVKVEPPTETSIESGRVVNPEQGITQEQINLKKNEYGDGIDSKKAAALAKAEANYNKTVFGR